LGFVPQRQPTVKAQDKHRESVGKSERQAPQLSQ